MEIREILVAMTVCGVVSAVSEKLLNVLGKSDLANLCNVAGLSGIALTGLGLVAKLIKLLATM